jgi:carbonic anhydrase
MFDCGAIVPAQHAADEEEPVLCEQCSDPLRLGLSRRALLFSALSAGVLAAAGPAPSTTISGDEALHQLLAGNARYVANHTTIRDYARDRVARVTTHRPAAIVLSCADARVGPEFLFDQGPGDLFVVRVAGNIVHDDGVASMEYAAAVLGTRLIVVLGHSQCGAVDAAIKVVQENVALPGHLPGLIDQIKPAVLAAQKAPKPNLLDAAIAENVRQSMQLIRGTQPVLAAMIADGRLKMAGGVYDIATGRVALV